MRFIVMFVTAVCVLFLIKRRGDSDVKLYGLNRAKRRIGMTTNAEKICGSISEGFAPYVIEQETIVLWKPHYLLGLHQGKVVCPVSTEKERLKES